MRQPLPDRLTRSPLPGLGDTLASRVASCFFTNGNRLPQALVVRQANILAGSV